MGEDDKIAAARMSMTDRAGRWLTEQIGRYARSVNEVAIELGCDWHTVNDTLLAYGAALIDDDPDRYGTVTALGLDEVLVLERLAERLRSGQRQYGFLHLANDRRAFRSKEAREELEDALVYLACAWLKAETQEVTG